MSQESIAGSYREEKYNLSTVKVTVSEIQRDVVEQEARLTRINRRIEERVKKQMGKYDKLIYELDSIKNKLEDEVKGLQIRDEVQLMTQKEVKLKVVQVRMRNEMIRQKIEEIQEERLRCLMDFEDCVQDVGAKYTSAPSIYERGNIESNLKDAEQQHAMVSVKLDSLLQDVRDYHTRNELLPRQSIDVALEQCMTPLCQYKCQHVATLLLRELSDSMQIEIETEEQQTQVKELDLKIARLRATNKVF